MVRKLPTHLTRDILQIKLGAVRESESHLLEIIRGLDFGAGNGMTRKRRTN